MLEDKRFGGLEYEGYKGLFGSNTKGLRGADAYIYIYMQATPKG